MIEIPHVLPDEKDGDTSWFARQNTFEQQEILRQVAFKRKYWPELGNGRFAKLPRHTYPHIFPNGNERKAFYPPIADFVLNYLADNDIALHTEALNLKSSQVACFNFLYPLRQNLSLATEIFRQLNPDLHLVTCIEFEYTGGEEATKWLGEPAGGRRGQNRTSIDAVIFWTDQAGRPCASLIEWKYTEHSFGVCSAFEDGSAERQMRCRSLNVAEDPAPGQLCFLTSGKRHCQRRYWEHMAQAGIQLKAFAGLHGCPFQGPFYQLMRQHQLAAYLRHEKHYSYVEVLSVSFSGNQFIHQIPTHLLPFAQPGEQDILGVWNQVLSGVSPMRQVYVEQIMDAVDQTAGVDPGWRSYLRERYGV